MVRYLALAALTLALAACSAGPRPDGPHPAEADAISVSFEIDYTTSQPVEGELATFIVTVKNTGSSFVLIRDLVQGGQVLASWQRAMPGVLKLRESADEFIYDPRPPTKVDDERFDPPRPVFNTSMIVPGEEIIFKPRIRLLGMPKDYAINYWTYSLGDVKNEIYFLADRAARPMRFRRLLDERELEKALMPDPTLNTGSHRTVVFPHAEKVLFAPKRIALKLDPKLERRAFKREDAVQKAGFDPAAVRETSFYAGLEVWALRTDVACAWVGAESVVPLPYVDNLELFCYALDSAGFDAVSVEFRGGLASAFANSGYRVIATRDPRDRTRTVYTALIQKKDLVPFLDLVRTSGCKLNVSVAESGFRILVTR